MERKAKDNPSILDRKKDNPSMEELSFPQRTSLNIFNEASTTKLCLLYLSNINVDTIYGLTSRRKHLVGGRIGLENLTKLMIAMEPTIAANS